MSENKKKTVLVTVAAGSLAKRVIARLHGRYHVVAVDFRRKVETDADLPSYKVEIHTRGFEDVFRKHKIDAVLHIGRIYPRSEEHTSELQSLMRISYAVFCLYKHSTYNITITTAM